MGMAFRKTADSCQDGPCPLMAVDEGRGKALLQGYEPAVPSPELGPVPPGELRIEMDWAVLEKMIDDHRKETGR